MGGAVWRESWRRVRAGSAAAVEEAMRLVLRRSTRGRCGALAALARTLVERHRQGIRRIQRLAERGVTRR